MNLEKADRGNVCQMKEASHDRLRDSCPEHLNCGRKKNSIERPINHEKYGLQSDAELTLNPPV